MNSTLTVGSLFSGIGGLDLGLERAGMRVEWQCEIDEYATKVLEKHWPDVTRFRDVRECGKHNLAPVDLICGGFPCQPHSLAGKRAASNDERDLWGEFYCVICEIKPTWVVAENVPGLLSSEDGRFFGRILRDLAQAGYDAEWQCLRASDFGAPHQRERVFIVAHAVSPRRTDTRHISTGQVSNGQESGWFQSANRVGRSGAGNVAHTASKGLPFRGYAGLTTGDTQARAGMESEPERYGTRQTQPRICGNADGFSGRLDGYRWPARPGDQQYEWEPPRVVTEKLPYRAQRLKALGNAVVPQVAEYIGRCILARVESEAA